MNKFLFTLLFCAFFYSFAQLPYYYQQHVSYKMDIDVDVANFTYKGYQNIKYTNNSPDELKVVYFHLYWNAFKAGSMMDAKVHNQGDEADSRLTTLDAKGSKISRLSSIPANEEGVQNIHWIKQNNVPLKFEIQGTIMKVYLDNPIKPNSSTEFSMEWDANIPKQIRRAGRRNKEGIEMTMTQWYPKVSEYDYEGWAAFDYVGREFHEPFADFDVNIKINKDYIIGAGGTLQNPKRVKGYDVNYTLNPDSEGKVSWHWKAQNILDFAWSADPDYTVESFVVPDGPKIYLVYQKSEKTKYWGELKPYLTKYYQIMNSTFGEYLYPSYAFIQGGDGGMEYGMCSMVLGEASSLSRLVGLMAHEGAHSWFQQILATNESMRPWMDEGFTSYAEDYTMYTLFPTKEPNPFAGVVDSYISFVKTGKEEPAGWLGDHHDSERAYSVASYTKGELFLVELGYIMGENMLKQVMKKYYDVWHLKHPNGKDFLHIAQNVSGMDLKWFYHYWINTKKTIDYAIKNVQYNANSTTITLENKGGVPMPIDFNVFTKDKKIVTYNIPLNMMRTPKVNDYFGSFQVLKDWRWTDKIYQFDIPFTKDELVAMGIDFTQRLADINPQDNFIEVGNNNPQVMVQGK
ncbi:M1 family metallopeptidase [Riemerella columbipharyngis]|uniref:Peptidase M1 membrane alanine aminopeptidase domain-containing protein n=1 Tax=Riemerella columbipharyngis TaxID=1071918 RepID=A0A1G7ES72_9FLAO|nr:M1 family metallopeptidase [Riemerella columbipharyngis]SDE66467.1 hypothetical protein SAMN05421544_11720 [Riemerella columbipharyngis]